MNKRILQKMTTKDQSKFPYDRSEYVVMPPIRKAEDGTLTTEQQNVDDMLDAMVNKHKPLKDCLDETQWARHQGYERAINDCRNLFASFPHIDNQPTPIDVDALKREVNKHLNEAYIKTNDENENSIVSSVIDYLAATGRLKV